MKQFLIEAVLICLVGGFIGIALSSSISLLFNSISTDFKMDLSVMAIIMACCFSTLIGVLFGFLPARNAAKLNPAVTLMSD